MSIIWIIGCFALSAGVCWMVKRACILDHPNHRSSHSTPTPRGGGLGVLAAIGLGLILALQAGLEVRAIAVTVLGFGLLGLADDLLSLGTKLKFSVMTALGTLVVWMAGPVASMGVSESFSIALPLWLGFTGSVLWVFVAANAVNFMDGSDGLIVAIFVPVGLALGLTGEGAAGITGYALAAGLVGFAIFNVPRAWLFLGDSGSLAIGAVFAVAGLQLIETPGDVWLYPLLILPVLSDVLLTLAGKVRNGIGFLNPHRTHAYQLLARMGWPHWRVALAYFIASSLCAVMAMLGATLGGVAPFAMFLAAVVAASFLHAWIRRKAIRFGLDLKT
ncbi:MAG: hypothetical protein COW29_09250 [Rhodobacterales bacterium CG15_BIG_FIL_POST_REV_8_21_14_020_59_13]|nr:MAG: hypothetical protein COW29_09250 [Rhodobacterales bacterium CG15_BIG_FIL_POST_REV_8_21_14_020_59_13]